MPRIIFQGDDRPLDAEPDESLLHLALRAGLPHFHACGGNARCSTCRVLVLEGADNLSPRTDAERALAGRLGFPADVRLACQARPSGDVTVRRLVVDEEDRSLALQDLRGGDQQSVGEERSVAILFADLRNFTALSERLVAYDVIHLLNRYFNRVGAVVNAHHGQIDNYMGDGVMAIFGVERPESAVDDAVAAGLEIIAAVHAMQPYVEAQFQASLRAGVGIHYGEVVLGAVGAGERRRLTAIGDTVNLASRIEAANKEAGTEVLISEAAHAEVRERVVVGRRVELPIKGKTGMYALYEVLGRRS